MSSRIAAWFQSSGPGVCDLPDTRETWQDFAGTTIETAFSGLILQQTRLHRVVMPSECRERLRQAALAVAANNLNLIAELGSMLKEFNRASVPVMLLKGAALNLTVYERPDLRAMSDLDLLIRPEDTEAAFDVLAACGCRRGCDLMRDDFFPTYHYEAEFITESPAPARIDLHARPFRPTPVSRTMPDDALWQDAQSVRVAESNALIPRPELMFLHLAAHAAFHGCSRLLWLYDLKRLVDCHNDSMDWGLVTQCAREWRISLPVVRAVERAAEFFGPVCPASAVSEMGRHDITWRDKLVLIQAPRDAASPAAHIFVDLLCTPGLRFKMGYLLALLRPGSNHLADVYPYRHRGWMVCAYLWRCLRALGRGVATPLQLLKHATGRLLTRRLRPRAAPHSQA